MTTPTPEPTALAAAGIEPALYLAPFIGAAHRLKGDGITLWDGALRFVPMMKPIR